MRFVCKCPKHRISVNNVAAGAAATDVALNDVFHIKLSPLPSSLCAKNVFINGPFPASFYFIFVPSIVNMCSVIIFLLMAGFELRTSGDGSSQLSHK